MKMARFFLCTTLLALSAILLTAVPTVLASGDGYGPGRVELSILAGRDHVAVGTGGIWNSRDKLHIQLDPADGWRIKNYHADLGCDVGDVKYSPPLTTTGNPKIGHFDYKETYPAPYLNEVNEDGHPYRRTLVLYLEEDMGFRWGTPYAHMRTQGLALFVNLVKVDESGHVIKETGAWVVPELVTWIVAVEETEESVETEVVVTGEESLVDENGAAEVAEVSEVKNTKKGKVAKKEHQKAKKSWVVDEAEELIAFDGGRWGWWFRYTMAHPKTGHFIDSPVAGLHVETPTYEGITDEDAKFDYFPGEEVDISLGSVYLGFTVADHKISPLDIFPMADTDDVRVINMARLLQSLDVDADSKGGIVISPEVVGAFEQAMTDLNLTAINFAVDIEVEDIIDQTITNAGLLDPPILLVSVSAEEAKAHLDETLNNVMFRKNISRTPELASTKAKMNISPVWFPALRANGEPASYTDDTGTVIEGIPYYDADGNFIRMATEAKPIIITYTDGDPEYYANDVYAAISRDDGNTWKKKNLSRAGDRTSFQLANGQDYYGMTKKPVFQVKGNKILVAWTSKFAKGGKPRYAIKIDDPATPDIDEGDDYPFDDVYYTEDIWGVGGPQRSVDYVEQGYPEVGEVPYSCVWTCRGIILTAADLLKAPFNGTNESGALYVVGDIVWFKPERLTSGRRDANLIFLAGASSAGFAMVWQEDPKGLRPGRAVGPGPGWGGATTAHKTEIWYSFVTWADHTKVDLDFVAGGDPEHVLEDHVSRPKALVPMSLPVRITDNDVLNMKNMGIDDTTIADDVAYSAENLTRCVKFEAGKTIVEADDPDAGDADYTTLRALPEDHYASQNCINCHVPYGTDPHGENPTQGAPIPLVVLDAATQDYLGGFTNGDCVSCHYSHIVPRDRVIMVAPGLDEAAKCAECESKNGIWKDSSDGGDIVEAYYPYTGYPYIFDDGSINDGTHGYGLALDGLLSGEYHTFINYGGNETSVAIATDGRLMDGDTGAARGNLFMQPYSYMEDGVKKTSAWAIITYVETKGAGSGPPDNTGESETHRDDYIPESGKNIIYHSFDFRTPDLVSAGNIMNPPECVVDEVLISGAGIDPSYYAPVTRLEGKHITPRYIVDVDGVQILDWLGNPQIAYENARRGRFILQGIGAIKSSRTIMLMVYKMGEEGTGRPSDIMMQRWVVPEEDVTFTYKDDGVTIIGAKVTGNPYRFENIVGDRVVDPLSGTEYWASGPVNMSSVTPTVTTPSQGDPEHEDSYGAVKVVEWEQTVDNFGDHTSMNRFDDARAHRGQIRGNFVQLGMSYCPNWAASRGGHDKYNFFIRRSFDGGATWTTKSGGEGVTHCNTWTYPSGTQSAGEKVEVCTFYPAGEFEAMRNLTQLPNAKESTIEPRIVAVPGTIKTAGVWTGIPEDKQNPNVFYVAWGTASNPKKDPVTKEQEEPAPADLYWSVSVDQGETYYMEEWDVNPDSDGNLAGETVFRTPFMAKGDQEQGEVQLRMTPDGSRFYASWLDEGEEGSDIVFRRIMPPDFLQNWAATATTTAVDAPEEDIGSDDDFTSDSGGDD